MIKNFLLSTKAIVMTSGSSMGTQPKYFEEEYWYKMNRKGYEGLAEYLVSMVLSCSNIANYVTYEVCYIDGKPGCRSENFLKTNEKFISLDRLYTIFTGRNLNDAVRIIDDIESRIQYVISFVKKSVDLDITEYLADVLLLDAITINNDRHFNNLGIIINEKTEEVKEAPIFDNGDCLLSDYGKFEEDTIEENIEKSIALPFSSNAYAQARILPSSLKIDYEILNNLLDKEPKSRAIDALKYQLHRYRDVVSMDKENKITSSQEIIGR